MIRAIAIVLALMLFSGGCGDQQQEGSIRGARTTTVTEQAAIDTAKSAVQEREGWSDVDCVAVPMGNGWQITATRTSNGEVRVVILDGEGNVSMYR